MSGVLIHVLSAWGCRAFPFLWPAIPCYDGFGFADRTGVPLPRTDPTASCVPSRHYSPALALTLLDPKLEFSEAETAVGVEAGMVVGRADGSGLTPHDLRRLQARPRYFLRFPFLRREGEAE